MKKRLPLFCASVVLAVSVAYPAFAAQTCFTTEEAKSIQLRQFHSRLQVAALKCNAPEWGLQDRYNSYVTKFSSALSSNAQSLRSTLKRMGLAQSEAHFDRFITRIFNRSSALASNSVEYCQDHRHLLDTVLEGDLDTLFRLADLHEHELIDPGACAPPSSATDTTAQEEDQSPGKSSS